MAMRADRRAPSAERFAAIAPTLEEQGWAVPFGSVTVRDDGTVVLFVRHHEQELRQLIGSLDPTLDVQMTASTARHVVARTRRG
jgi:hypothetical protein